MVYGKKFLIWDLDDTLYLRTPEWADMLDSAMAEALVWDLKVPMSVEEAKQKVTESYTVYRNGGEIFYRDYGVNPADLFMLITRESRLKKLRPTTNCWKKSKRFRQNNTFLRQATVMLPKRY